MADLIFLAGLLLAQALSTNDIHADTVPVGVLDVHGQPHLLHFEEQSPADAMASVEAALMMHARDAARYGIVEPGYLQSSDQHLHQLQVSERGSSGDLSIRFSLAHPQPNADSDTASSERQFEHFEIYIRGQRLDAQEYAHLISQLKRGYVANTETTGQYLPELPLAPIKPGGMI